MESEHWEHETQPVPTPTYVLHSRTRIWSARHLCTKNASPHGERNFSWARGQFSKWLCTWHSLPGYQLPKGRTASQDSSRALSGAAGNSGAGQWAQQGQSTEMPCPLAQLWQHHCHSAWGWLQVQNLPGWRVEKLQGNHWSDNAPVTCFSFSPIHQQNLYSSPSWLYPLPFQVQAPCSVPPAVPGVAHKHWLMRHFLRKQQQVIKMALRCDLCVFGNSDADSHCRLARDRGRESGCWLSIRKLWLKAKNWLVSSSQRVEYGPNAASEHNAEIYFIVFCTVEIKM